MSGGLLGCLHFPFNQLQQRQAAAAQLLAFLQFVDGGERYLRYLKQHLSVSGLANTAALACIIVVRFASANPGGSL